MAIISNKFNHGDIVIGFHSNSDKPYFGKVLIANKITSSSLKRRYKYRVADLKNHKDIVIYLSFEDNNIDFDYENDLRLATEAERILYAKI